MKKGFLLSLFCCLSSIASFATNYYYQGGTFTTAANWNDNPVGGGGTPVDFTNGADVWIVTSTNALLVNAVWSVAGQLQIDGTCTISTNPTITGGITVNSGGTLNQNATNTATVPNMAAVQSGTVAYGAGTHAIPAGITFGNLTIGAVTAATASGDITVNGTLTVASTEILVMGTNQLIAGTSFAVANSGTISTASTASQPIPSGYSYAGSVTYNGTGAQTIVGGTYLTLTISGARGGADITFEPSTTVRIGNGTTAAASLTVSATGVGNYITTNNTIAYGKSNGAQTIANAIPYNNLSLLNTSGTQTAGGNLTINGALTVTASTMAMSTFQLLTTPTSVTNGGTITTTNTSGTPFPTGINWGGTGTVSYLSTAAGQTVMAGIYNNLIVGGASGTLTFTAEGDLTVNGTFTTSLSTTTLDMGTHLLSVVGTVTNTGIVKTANVTSTPIPSGKTWAGTVEYNGTGAQTISTGTYTTLTISGARGGADITFPAGTVKAGNGAAGAFNLTATGVGNYVTTGNTFVYGRTNGSMTVASTIPYNNVSMLNSSLTNTVDGDLTVSGTLLTTASGTLNMSTFRLIDGGALAVTNGGTLQTSHIATSTPLPTGQTWTGTVNYSGAGSQTVMAGSYTALTISGDHVGGDITLESGNVSIGGNFSLTGTNINSYITTGNTVTYRATTGGQTVAGITYNNLAMLNTSGTNTAGGAITVNGALTIPSGSTFSMSTFQFSGTPTISNAGTFATLNTSGTPITSDLDWGITGTITFSAAGATTIPTGTYNNMTISGNKAAAAVTLASGDIYLNGTTFTGTATNVGSYVTTGNNMIFNRAAGGGTLFALAIPYNDLTFNNTSGTYTAGGAFSVGGTLTTTAGGTLAMSTSALSGTPTIVNNGTISTANISSNPLPSGLDWGSAGTVTFASATNTAMTVVTGTYNNLTTSNAHGAAAVTLASGDIIVNNTLNWGASSTNFVTTGNTLTLNNLTGSGSNINSTALTLNNLTLNNTSNSYKAGANLVVGGTLTTTAGGTLDMQTSTLTGALATIANNGTIRTASTTNPPLVSGKDWGATGTIAYSAVTGAQTVPTGTYNNLTFLNTSGTNTVVGTPTVNGALAITAGTLQLGTNQLLGTLTSVSNGGTITTTNTTGTPIPSGINWGTTGTVSFAVNAAQTVPGGTYNNLSFSQTSLAATAAGDITVNGTLTTTTGTGYFDLGSNLLIAGGSFAATNNGTIKTANATSAPIPSGASWSGTTGVVEYNGTGAQTIVTGTYKTLTLSGDKGAANITLASGTIDLTGNFNVTATNIGGYVNTGNTFRYTTLTGTQTIGGIGYNNLTMLNTSGTNTAGAAVTINGMLTITAGGTMAMSTFQMLGTPSITNNGTITTANTGSAPFPTARDWSANSGTGTVTYGGTTTATIVAGTYYNLTTTGTHNANTITLESGNIQVNNTLNWGASTSSFANTGNTLTLNSFTGNGTAINSTALTLNNLTLNNTSSSYKAGAGLVVNGTLSTTAGGTLDMQTNTLTGTLGTITNNGTIRTTSTNNPAIPASKNWGSAGTVIYAATAGAQSFPAGTYHNVTFLNTSATNSVVGTVTINGTLTTTAGGTVAMQTNQLLGTPTIAHFGTLSTTNVGSTPFPVGLDWTNGGSTGTVSYGGTTTATIVTGTYYNLTTTGAHVANAITLASGTITVNNNLAWGASTTNFVNSGNTLVLNNAAGSGSNINSAALTLNNLTLNNTSSSYTAGAALTVNGILTSAAGGTLDMSTFALAMGGGSSTSGIGTIKTSNSTATPLTASRTWTQTVEFGSAAGQSIVAGTYGNLVLSNAGTKTATGAVTVSGNLTLGSSNTLADGGNTVTVSGNILGTGTHTGAGKIAMNGGSKTISGATLQNLQLSNAGGFSLAGDLTVNGTLTFTAGILDLGTNNLTFGATAATAAASASSMVIATSTGELRKSYTTNGLFTFPIGDNVGPNYSPISLNFTGGTYGGGAYATAKVTKAAQPQNYSGTDYLNRYWTVSTSNITSPVYTVTATYVPGDVVGTESLMYMGEYSSSTWTQHGVANTVAHTISTNANVTATSADFTGVGGPGVSVNSATVCPTGSATLTATASSPFTPVTYAWAPATGLSATTGASVTATPSSTTVYTVTATDNHGLTGIGTATVTVTSQPSLNIGLSATGNFCPTVVMTLTATPSGGTGTPAYTWSGPGISGSPSSGATPSYTAIPSPSYTLIPTNAPGSYTVVLTYSGSGCQSVSATSSSITPAVHQWVGGASGDVNNWNNDNNWVCGVTPIITDHILIPNMSNQPTILASATGNVARLYINTGATLTLGSSATLNISGNLTNNGSISAGTGSNLIFNGSSAQTIAGSVTAYNMQLNNSTGLTIAGVAADTVTVKGTLTLTSGTLTTAGRLMLYADNTTNGRIGPITGGAISGNIVAQTWIQTVSHPAWHFYSHPFDNYIPLTQLIASIDMTGAGGSSVGWVSAPSNNPSSFWIDVNSGWVPFTNPTANTAANQFKRHQGIRMYVWGNKNEVIWGGSTSTSVRIRTYGHPNTGTQNVTLSKATTDYNQVGNPYPSPVNVGQVVKDAFDAGDVVGPSYWVWDPALGTTGQYVVKTIDGSAFYLAMGNAFQLRATNNGDQLVFNESHKGTTPSISLRKYTEGINLTVYDATYHPWDMLSVKFSQEASENEENSDTRKPESPADLNFYSVSSDDIKLNADVRPYAAGKVVPLGINSNVKSQFILKADNVNVPTGARVYLHDKLLNKYQLMTQGAEYAFSINENGLSQGDNRFELTMEELHAFDLHTNVTLEAALAPNPAVNEVAVSYTTSGAENTTISIADVSGHVVFTKDAGTARNGKVIVPVAQFASGVYLVTITSGDARIERTLIKE
jgi:hypothetical protein